MTVAHSITLDARFDEDIRRVRRAFQPGAQGTRGNTFVPVVVGPPEYGKGTSSRTVTLHLFASNLYIYGWTAGDHAFRLSDCPEGGLPDAEAVAFSSHYSSLGVDALPKTITARAITSAVMALGKAEDATAANGLRQQVGLMALAISESLRNVIVAGLVRNALAHGPEGLDRDLVLHYARNYSKYAKGGYPDIALPPEG